eukprot:2161550-Rhodomonas_salina.1
MSGASGRTARAAQQGGNLQLLRFCFPVFAVLPAESCGRAKGRHKPSSTVTEKGMQSCLQSARNGGGCGCAEPALGRPTTRKI